MRNLLSRYQNYLLDQGSRYDAFQRNFAIGTVTMPWIAPVLVVIAFAAVLRPNFEQRIYILCPLIAVPLIGAVYASAVFLWGGLRADYVKSKQRRGD